MGQNIKDKKVYLCSLGKEHLEKTFSWVQRAEFRESFNFIREVSWDDHVRWFDNLKNNDTQKHFAIYSRENNRHVGNCGLKYINKEKDGEIWVYIGDVQDCRKGFGVSAASQLIYYAFYDLNIETLYLYVAKNNIAAKRLYEKLGFEEREMPSESEWKSRDVPHYYMEKSRAA
jgi:RimJ/RimL family protein N-acetyltransferase